MRPAQPGALQCRALRWHAHSQQQLQASAAPAAASLLTLCLCCYNNVPALQMGRVGSMLRSWSLDVCPQRLIQVRRQGCGSGGWDRCATRQEEAGSHSCCRCASQCRQ